MLGLGSGINRFSIVGPGFDGLLDESYGSGAAAAYSVRRLTNRVSVAMTIRRDSDSTETDIGFDSNGDLDESAITAFCTGTTCRVASWKDQSGNDNHAVQTTAANQPTIYTGGEIVKENGRPAVTKGGNISYLDVSSFSMTQPYSSIFVAKHINNSSTRFNAAFSTIDGSVRFDTDSFTGNNSFVMRAGAFLQTIGNRDFVQHLWSTLWNGSSSYAYKDGVSEMSGNAGSNNMNSLRLGGSNAFGTLQEFIFYDSDQSSNRTDIESNIVDYFTQNTPLLDTYTGAAAAFSLRKLSSSYSGAAIRVRRDNDNLETDINFNVFGGLDTASLAAHCGSNNGYVTNWYDQSSNSNTARQTTAANQPKIYDSSTGVITENGKPAVEFDGSTSTMSTGITPAIAYPSSEENTTVVVRNNLNGNAFIGDNDPQQNYRFTPNRYGLGGESNSVSFSYTTNVQELGFAYGNRASSIAAVYRNGSFIASKTTLNPHSSSTETTYLGSFAGARAFWSGKAQEIIIYPSDQSANRTNIENNINTFYSIY